MAAYRFPAEDMRALLRSALPTVTATGASDDVEARFHYVPELHARALSRDVAIVRGIRGAGKTLWWKALQDEGLRQRVIDKMDALRYLADAKIITCFGAGGSDLYPSGRTISHLLEQGNAADDIWRAIVLWGAASDALPRYGADDWSKRVAWVAKEVEKSEGLLHRVNDELESQRKDLLLLFDGLDRAGRTWPDVRRMLRGLFEVLVELRELKRIRGKAFIRPEMLDTPEVTSFQDASKLLNDAVDLEWRPADLYGLLWQYLSNADQGSVFREGCKRFSVVWEQVSGVWIVPDRMRRDPKLQEQILTSISGIYMGSDHRRGKVYTWLPNHLGDALRQVSPRSFLVALRRAADVASSQTATATAVDRHAIKDGVSRASEVRRREIEEDQPWVAEALTPLQKLLVPTPEKTVLDAWKKARLLEKLQHTALDDRPNVPRYIDEQLPGIMRELQEIGVLGRSPDGRVQMPDVYRIAFGISRRGGVPPVKR